MPAPVQTASAYAKRPPNIPPILGLSDFSAANHFTTPAGGGEAGAITGFGFAAIGVLTALANGRFLSRWNGSYGYDIDVTTAAIRVSCADTTFNPRTVSIAISAADLHRELFIVGRYDGAGRLTASLYRGDLATALTFVGYTPATAGMASMLGYNGVALTNGYLRSAMTWRGALSDQMLFELLEDSRRFGDMPKGFRQTMPIIYGARQPAVIAAGNFLSTAAGVRCSPSGFVGVWCTISSLAGTEVFIATTANGQGGYVLMKQGGYLVIGRRDSGAQYSEANTYAFTDLDVNRRMLVGLSHDGAWLRAWLDGVNVGSVALSQIGASTAPMTIGSSYSGYPTQFGVANNMTALGVVGGDGQVLTAGEWVTLLADTTANGAIGTVAGKATHRWDIAGAIAANGGVLPASVPNSIGGADPLTVSGTVYTAATGAVVTHRWSVTDALAATIDTVADGDTAPASLADTITGAAADLQARVGSPKVSVRGRRSNERRDALLGWLPTNYLEGASLVRTDPTGYQFSLWATPWSIATTPTYRHLFGIGQSEIFVINGTQLSVTTQAGAVTAPVFTLTTLHLGLPILIHGVFRGATFEAYVNGISTGAPVAATATAVASLLRLGGNLGGSYAADWTIHGFQIGRIAGGISAADALAHYQWVMNRRRIDMLYTVGATEHLYDFPNDLSDIGGSANGVPTVVIDRIGTDNLTRFGGYIVQQGALRSTDKNQTGEIAYHYLRTLPNVFLGATAGFWFEVTWYYSGETAWHENFFGMGNASVTTGGAQFIHNGGNTILQFRASGAMQQMVAGPVNTIGWHHAAFVYTAAGQGLLYVDGTQQAVTATGLTYEVPPTTTPITLGATGSANYPVHTKPFGGAAAGLVVPTAGEIAAAAAYSIANGGRVGGIAGKTSKRWSIPEDVAEAGGRVPAFVKERVSGVDHATFFGYPLLPAPRVERLYATERDARGLSKPIMSGIRNFTTASVARTANGGGSAGSFTSGIWWAGLFKYLSTTGVSGSILGKCGVSTLNGFEFFMSGGTLLFVRVVGATDWINGPMLTLGTADVGKLFLIGGWIDPLYGLLRGFAKRAQIGSGVGCTVYQPGTTRPFFIGGRTEGGTIVNAVPNFICYGAMCGQGVPQLVEWQYAHDAAMADEEIVALPGARTEHLWNIKRDYQAANGMPTQILDRIGTDHMSIVGTDLRIEHQYARLWA